MLSDISDLTDLSSDEEDVPVVSKTRSKTKKREYQITQSLRPPRTSQYTAKALYDSIVENTIDLDPEYQRDVVWPDSKQIGLIDSLLHNYYIPPIIFAVSATDEGYEKRTCIDGKQRLTSIQRFMDGLIPHKDSFTNQKMWYSMAGVSGRKSLPPQYKKIFSNKQIVCMEYENLTGDQEREIFQRVQLGVALTPAERMQAISGPWPSLIREVLSQVLGEDGFDGYLEWGRGRGRDFQCMTSIAYIIEKFPKHTNAPVTQLEKWLQDGRPVPAKFRDSLFDTFRIFVVLARDKKLTKCFQSPTRVSPVEFVMIGLLIHVYSAKFSFAQLSSAIGKLRADVRANFVDIRMNTKIMKHMFNFVSKSITAADFRDGRNDPPAAAKGKAAPAKPPKRKRTMVDSDDEADGSVRPAKAKTTAGSPSKGPKTSASQAKPSKLLALPLPKPPPVPRPAVPKMKSSQSPPIPAPPVATRVPRIPTVASAASKPPAPAVPPPTPPTPAPLPPTPAIPPQQAPPPPVPPTPAPARPKISPPRLSSLPSITNNHALSVKTEPRASPPTPIPTPARPPLKQEPPAPPYPDRLAPLRAAKAAVQHDAAAPALPPSLPAALQGETADAPPLSPDLKLTQDNLDALLLRAGYQRLFQPQQLQPVPAVPQPQPPPASPQAVGPRDMSAPPGLQPPARRASQDALPVKPLLPRSGPPSRRASAQGPLLATPMAPAVPPPAAAPAPAPPRSASSSSSRRRSPTPPPRARHYDPWDYRDRRGSGEPGRRGSADARYDDYDWPKRPERDRDREWERDRDWYDRDAGYRRGSRDAREWERGDRGCGFQPGGRFRKD